MSLNGVNDFIGTTFLSLANISSISRSGEGPHPVDTDTLTFLSLTAGDNSRPWGASIFASTLASTPKDSSGRNVAMKNTG
jgi:hypothetical protein